MTVVRETIRIDAESRWDAVDLARRLGDHHTHLVRLGNRRWHVCVRSDAAGEELPAVRAVAERWAVDRHVDATLRYGVETFELHG